MQVKFFSDDRQQTVPQSSRWRVLLCITLLLPQLAVALETRPLSPSVVLVLKLVSTTHVMPTTGVVISDEGRVLVSADFALSDGEIIVLDGGTDIVRHGRPASIVQHSGPGGLAILSVNGLERPGIILSEGTPGTDTELQLTAFPPAEDIAKGAPPLRVPVKLFQGGADEQVSISTATPLPYVSGAILDACGYLTGVSLATGLQSIEPGTPPVTLLADEFRRELDSIQLRLPVAKCDYEALQSVQVTSKEAEPDSEEPPKSTDSGLVKPEAYRPEITRKRLNPFQGATPRPAAGETAEPPSLWLSIPWWLPLLVIMGLAALIWKAYVFYRHHRNKRENTSDASSVSPERPAAAEPGMTFSHEETAKPRSGSIDVTGLPDLNALPNSCNGVLVIDCFIDSETRLRRFCVVNRENMSIVIGRGDADINIEHAMISPAHARLERVGEHMTLADLGSKWGTSINGIACLPGEVMFIGMDDEIFLGDIQILITILMKEADAS